jgi:hypothetical protein
LTEPPGSVRLRLPHQDLSHGQERHHGQAQAQGA